MYYLASILLICSSTLSVLNLLLRRFCFGAESWYRLPNDRVVFVFQWTPNEGYDFLYADGSDQRDGLFYEIRESGYPQAHA